MDRLNLFILVCAIIVSSCQKEVKITYDDLKASYHASNDSIQLVSYRLQRIDTFSDGGVWDNKGFAHLERHEKDTIFGFNFYAKRDDVPQISIYDQGKNFDLDMEEMVYELSPGGYYFSGSPGGQMVSSVFFELDESYESVKVKKLSSGYEVIYTYPDDSLYLVTQRQKKLVLNQNYKPISVKRSSLQQGDKTSTTLIFSDIKINNQVGQNLEHYKNLIKEYTLLTPEEYVPSDYIGTPLPSLYLTNIKTDEKTMLRTDKILLIDFWEVWCGWCIKSFPDVEKLSQDYKDQLDVIGIATESKGKALDLIATKGITFTNYFEDQELLDKFNIRAWPTYILVNQNGIIVKEYFGFSEDIETDIKSLINERS